MPSVVCMLVRPIIFGINGNERLQRFDFGNSLESGAP